MASDTVQSSRDWLRSPRTNLLAWWIPQAAILAGLFVPVPARGAIWIVAFPRVLWMARIGCFHSRREQGHLVGDGAGMGKVLIDGRKPPRACSEWKLLEGSAESIPLSHIPHSSKIAWPCYKRGTGLSL